MSTTSPTSPDLPGGRSDHPASDGERVVPDIPKPQPPKWETVQVPRQGIPLRPRNGYLYVVRWPGKNPRHVRNQYYRQHPDAMRFITYLRKKGIDPSLYITTTEWEEIPAEPEEGARS